MKVIIVVSSGYLYAVKEESQKYSFQVQGYCSFSDALDRLIYTNVEDILGFAFLGDSLPKKGTGEYQSMLKFLYSCNLMRANKKFLIIIKETLKTNVCDKLREFNYLKISYQDGIEFITDIVINKLMFGSILLDNYEPYILKEEPDKLFNLGEYSVPVLNLTPVIPNVLFETLDFVHLLDSIEQTLEEDIVLQKYQDNQIITCLREIVILRKAGFDSKKQESMYADLIRKQDKHVGVYLAFLNYVLDRDKVMELE